jgi:hypothetical protein
MPTVPSDRLVGIYDYRVVAVRFDCDARFLCCIGPRRESFDIRLEQENSTVLFKGALRLCGTEDYAPILDMLKETLVGPAMPIVLDLRELDFLNSSGITMLSRFVMEARDRPESICRCWLQKRSWHARSLGNLQRLMPGLRIRLTWATPDQFLNPSMGFPGLNLPLPAPGLRKDRVIL